MKKTFSVYTLGAALLFALVGLGTGLAEESAKQSEEAKGASNDKEEKMVYSFPFNIGEGKNPVSVSVDVKGDGNQPLGISIEANPLQSNEANLVINGKKIEVEMDKEYCQDLNWKDDKGVEYKAIVITSKENDGDSKIGTIKGEIEFPLEAICASHKKELAKTSKELEALARELCQSVQSKMQQVKNVEMAAEGKIKISEELAEISEKLKTVTNDMQTEVAQASKKVQEKNAIELNKAAEAQKKS